MLDAHRLDTPAATRRRLAEERKFLLTVSRGREHISVIRDSSSVTNGIYAMAVKKALLAGTSKCRMLARRALLHLKNIIINTRFRPEASNPQYWHDLIDSDWKKAKKVADFTGMMTQAGILLFCARFFWSKANNTQYFLEKCIYIFCATAAAFSCFYIIRKLGLIVTSYYSTDLGLTSSVMLKLWFSVWAFIFGVVFSIGVWTLVAELARLMIK